ncbi:MAG: response regulator transcription factor [Spirochaetia bacterium]
MTVLVVEDHPLFREGILTVLDGREQFEVVGQADSRNAARELARAHRPDVAILDVSLADGDGLPLIEELSVVSPGTRCLVLSVSVDCETVSRAVELGAVGFVSKGTASGELISALEHAATDELYLDAEAQAALVKTLDQPAGQELDRSRFARLTCREKEVFRRLANGLGAKQIAYELGISRKTVDVHRSHIMKKLELDDGLDIVRMAARLGIIDMDSWAREVGADND